VTVASCNCFVLLSVSY